MSPDRGVGTDFQWPPTEEDLAAIEVIELARPPAETSAGTTPAPSPFPTPSRRPAAATAAAGTVVPATPRPVPVERDLVQAAGPPPGPAPVPAGAADTVQVLQLDARAGPEPYVVDLRRAAEGREPAALAVDAKDAAPALEWPPREADLDAITVVDLSPLRLERQGQGAGRHDGRAPAVPVRDEPAEARFGPRIPGEGACPLDAEESGWAGAESLDAGDGTTRGTEAPQRATGPVERGRWVIAAGLLVALASVAGWMAFGRADRGTGPATEAPVPASAGASRPGEARDGPGATSGIEDPAVPAVAPWPLDQARQALASGDRRRALGLTVAYIETGGDDRSALALLEDVLASARAGAERQRRQAIQRVGRDGGGEAMVQAMRREAGAQEAWRAGRFAVALGAFEEAERAFARVQAVAAPPEPVVADRTDVPVVPSAATPPVAVTGSRESTASDSPPGASPGDALRVAGAPVTVAPPPPRVPALPAPPPASASRPAPAGAEATPLVPGAEAAVRRALQAYRSAYETLDAGAAAAVYPSVDARALGRAFDGLRSQKLEFERCDVTTLEGDRAQATCVGRLAFVPKVGSQAPKVESRRWTFALQRQGDSWRIQRAQVGQQ